MKTEFLVHPALQELTSSLKANPSQPIRCGGLWGSSKALLAEVLKDRLHSPLLLVTGTTKEAEDLYNDLLFFNHTESVAYFPYTDILPYEAVSPFSDIVNHRISVLHSLLNDKINIIVTPVRALISRLIPPSTFDDASLAIKVDDLYEIDDLSKHLVQLGYERSLRVERAGEFSIKGGILDIFPSNLSDPCRIEFFDVEVESIRTFNASTQVSFAELKEVLILPQREIMLRDENLELALANLTKSFPESEEREKLEEKIMQGIYFPGIENFLPLFFKETVLLADFFPQPPTIIFVNQSSVDKQAANFLKDVQELYEGYFSETKLKLDPNLLFEQELLVPHLYFEMLHLTEENSIAFPFKSPAQFGGDLPRFKLEIAEKMQEGNAVAVLTSYEGQADRIFSLLENLQPVRGVEKGSKGKLAVDVYSLSEGIISPDLNFEIVLEREIFSRRRAYRRKFRSVNSVPIDSFLDLKPGDFVVHIQHGVGKFLGLERIETLGKEKDYLAIEYRDKEKLYVPLEMVNLVQKHLGRSGANPALDSIGGKSWSKAKAKVKKGVEKLAKELVVIYSARIKQKGYSFGADTKWQHEFEAGFEFEETPDQQKAIDAVKADMESDKPMDRLVCGDVGFGKTEVAIRAAFKAVMSGKQVALLAPTTILSEQHYQTFKERFELYPVSIDYLNRFRTAKEQKDIIARLNSGKLDLVIGTHGLLRKEIEYKNLGLLIVDEEQRFGVAHKEKLKNMRKLIDVITLTATPIPRTLHMSLIKVRDLSVISTPPRARLPVETYVMEFNEQMVKRAIMQELDRGGQVFYLHNRVKTILAVEKFINRLIPRASVGVAHGQLPEHKLEEVMFDFINGRLDILLSTSIIESGLDIPNANTLIVDGADNFGLSQLYQIRGRVGRSIEQAYAYLFYPSGKALTELAQKRLQVINDYTELGSGFNLAMRDMEIRGVGSIFGSEQSGDIMAVGFDTYCRLLEDAVAEFGLTEQETVVDTMVDLNYEGFIPDEFISDERQKIEIYKRISSCSSAQDVISLKDEVRDRFGKIPEGVNSLFKISELKGEGQRIGIKTIFQIGNQIKMEFYDKNKIDISKLAALVQKGQGVNLVPGDRLMITVKDPGGDLSHKVNSVKNILQDIE